LYETDETSLRNEFNILTIYTSKKELTFDEALKQGICKDITESDHRNVGRVKSDELIQGVLKFFEKSNSLADAEKEFVLTKARINTILRDVTTVGFNGIRYDLKKSKKRNSKHEQVYKLVVRGDK
jgi:hypothetical protein